MNAPSVRFAGLIGLSLLLSLVVRADAYDDRRLDHARRPRSDAGAQQRDDGATPPEHEQLGYENRRRHRHADPSTTGQSIDTAGARGKLLTIVLHKRFEPERRFGSGTPNFLVASSGDAAIAHTGEADAGHGCIVSYDGGHRRRTGSVHGSRRG